MKNKSVEMSTNNKKDEELVFLTLRDKEHYYHLIKRYEAKLLRYIIRLGKVQKEDAEDILQEVFVKTYQNLNNFDVSLKFSSWIYRIAHNQTVSFLRKKSSMPKTIGSKELGADGINYLDILISDLDFSDSIDKKYLRKNLLKLVDNLDQKYKDIIILRYMEDKNYEEISDILQKPIGTVATLIKRAKIFLKKEIENSKYPFKSYA